MRRLRLLTTGITAVVFVLALAWWAARPRYALGEGDLLRRAVRVCAWPGYEGDYAWLSDHEVLRFASVARGAGLALERADLSTGMRRRMPQFDTTFARLTRSAMTYQCVISPDGSSVLLDTAPMGAGPTIGSAPPRGLSFISTRDGSATSVASPTMPGPLHWMPDSRRWVSLFAPMSTEYDATIRPVADPDGTSTRSVTIDCGPSDRSLFIYMILGVSPGNQMVVGARQRGRAGGPLLWQIDLGAARPRPKPFPAAGPDAGASTLAWALSADCRRLAWCASRPRGVKPGLLDRVRARLGGPPFATDEMELWAGDLDGTHRRALGRLAVTRGEIPRGMTWMPDGRHVTFLMRGALWRVDAGRDAR